MLQTCSQGVDLCLFIFPFRCASSFDNLPTHRQNFSPALIGSARDAAASLPSRLKKWGVRLLSTQNPAEQLHGGAGVYTAVQTCNTHIAPQSIHRIPRVGKRTSRRPASRSTASQISRLAAPASRRMRPRRSTVIRVLLAALASISSTERLSISSAASILAEASPTCRCVMAASSCFSCDVYGNASALRLSLPGAATSRIRIRRGTCRFFEILVEMPVALNLPHRLSS